MADTKQRRPNWTEEERMYLVEAVNDRTDRLFAKFKGCGSTKGSKIKDQAWAEVVEALNGKSGSVKRSVDEARKQYANLKQRAKEKSDAIRRPKTGGGPKPASPSLAEGKILDSLADRPTLQGLLDGIDSEDFSIAVATVSENPGLTLENFQQDLSLPLDVTVDEEGIIKLPTTCIQSFPSSTTSKRQRTSNNKRKVADEEMLTLAAEKDKFLQEILKLKEETEFFKGQIEVSKLKKQKLEIEIELLKMKHATSNEM